MQSTMKTNYRSGFTLIEIMIVIAIIGLLAAIAIPSYVRSRTKSQQNACINNLRMIDGAKQQWALEEKRVSTDTPLGTDLIKYMGRGTAGNLGSTTCPTDSLDFAGSYEINQVDTAPTCKIVPVGTGPTDHVMN
jgi:prepilin-type N-terminal cleavage/methylation domain-containing protein